MSIFYRSKRVGQYGRVFDMLKFRTLKDGSDGSMFADGTTYTKFGRILRKTHLDETPQLWNILKGDMGFFGYRPEEPRTFDILPPSMKELLTPQKPGLLDLSSIYFFEEERLVQLGGQQAYWEKMKPMKFVLQAFYIENKCALLNLALLWLALRKVITRK